MPTLPNLETSQSVFNNVALRGQQIDAQPADFGGVTAQAAQGLAQGAAQASNNLTQVAMRQFDLQREADTNSAYTNYADSSRTLTDKLYSLQGKDAVAQAPQIKDQLDTLRNQYRDNLKDPVAQRMFDQVSMRHTQNVLDSVSRFADVQQKKYQQQVSDGLVNSFQQDAARHWNDPNAFNGALASIAVERTTQGQTEGQPLEFTNAKITHDISSTWIDRLKGMAASGTAQTALTLLNNGEDWTDSAGRTRHTDVRSQIEPNQVPAIQAELASHAADQIGVQYGTQATSVAPVGGTPIQNVVRSMESGGKDLNTDGTPVTSSAGAKYAMQVMPATAANPGFGIKPAASDTPEEYNRVGTQLLMALQSKYGADNGKVMAAYNAGAGRVDGAVQQYGADWLSHMPQETRDYVTKGAALLSKQPASAGAAAGAVSGTLPVGNTAGIPNAAAIAPPPVGLAQDPATMKADQDTRAEQARKDAEAHVLQLTGDPMAAKRAGSVAASTVIGNTNAAIAAHQERQRAAADSLTKMIAGDPMSGAQPITSIAALVANPQAYANYTQLSPQGQAAVVERLSKANQPLTQDGLNLYYKYRGEAMSDPEGFLKEDLSTAYGKMPEAQIMHLINLQGSLSKQDATKASRDLSWQRTKGDVDDMLKPLGLGSATAKTDADNLAKTSQFYGRLQESIEQYHADNSKWPDTVTTRKIAASLLVQGSQAGAGWFGLGSSTMPAFESTDLSKFSVPVPDAQKPQLSATFQKVMGRAPTDDELTQWYTKYTLSKKVK